MLTPTYANAVILYGQEACSRFESMIDYWTTMLDSAVWSQLLFILVSDEKQQTPKVPREVEETLRRNCWIMRTDCTTCPSNIIDAIRMRLVGGKTLVHCIYSDFLAPNAVPSNAVALVDDIVHAFPQGVVDTIYYLILNTEAQAVEPQRAMLKTLSYHPIAHVYLLSEMANDASTIDRTILWRAVFGEVLAVSAQRRTLMNGRLYSLGQASLNANDSELRNLRRQKANEVVRNKANQAITPADAWRIITQSNDALGETDSFSLRQKVEQWVMHVSGTEISVPNETERKNNRILSNVYQMELNMAAIENAIERFYHINSSLGDKLSETRQRLRDKYLHKMTTLLCGQMNTATFPLWLVDSLIAHLSDVERCTLRIEGRSVPKRKLMMSANDYCDACCEVYERNCAAAAPLRAAGLCAGALHDALTALRLYILAAKGAAEIICEPILKTDEHEYLTHKYPKYWSCVQETEHDQGETIFGSAWVASNAPYFADNGTPIADRWQGVITSGEQQLQQAMVAQFPGSFCNVVNQECPSANDLSDFFNIYLTESRRMLHNIADPKQVPNVLYYADRTFSNHPWIISRKSNCETVRNDNVERLDIYTLAHDLKWYLDDPDNFYLNIKTRQNAAEGEAASLWATRTYMPEAIETTPPKAPAQDEDRTHGLTIHMDGQRYLLTWTWLPHTSNAFVSIAQAGREVLTIPCSDAEFACVQGIDISNKLPYGKLEVSVFVGGRRYAYREMSGRKDTVRYRLERAADGTSTLVLKGKTDDLRKVVLSVRKRGDTGNLLYPINVARMDEVFRFSGLRLPSSDEAAVIPSPDDPFPTVQVLRE